MTVTSAPLDFPDRHDGLVYVMPPELDMAVRVALATGRPLLLRGSPGSGKSTVAAYVARQRNWRYYEHVITSRSQARDLLWTFDAVRRLADAQSGIRDLASSAYIEPGALWWAFDPESAKRRGAETATSHPPLQPFAEVNRDRSPDHAVVLIDEIDKADPDLPNGILVPLSSSSFVISELNLEVRKAPSTRPVPTDTARHLIIITTNEERELPEAFLRRCVVLWLDPPDADRLVTIAQEHFTTYGEGWTDSHEALAREVAQAVIEARDKARMHGIRPASTAEFLDALRACRHLGVGPTDDVWPLLRKFVLIKPQRPGIEDDQRHLAW
ncbi:AAA family ATPase [Virgisporangium aurantiacum]|uniref:ATPase n=1 Tax=Virgisporangium aurantiacum TaxID=175570 RepID=A0A8J3ZLY9_9ACTN|nr:MoxR family ATPase [Virgisporangium aurantiacum]GIJ63951.1 ATPase [Virgisporangium aurantiacum]